MTPQQCWEAFIGVYALPTKRIDCPAEKGAIAHSRRHGPRPPGKRGAATHSIFHTEDGQGVTLLSLRYDRCMMAAAGDRRLQNGLLIIITYPLIILSGDSGQVPLVGRLD